MIAICLCCFGGATPPLRVDADPEATMALLICKSRSAVYHVIVGCSKRSCPGWISL
jgi:hypothetical protein